MGLFDIFTGGSIEKQIEKHAKRIKKKMLNKRIALPVRIGWLRKARSTPSTGCWGVLRWLTSIE